MYWLRALSLVWRAMPELLFSRSESLSGLIMGLLGVGGGESTLEAKGIAFMELMFGRTNELCRPLCEAPIPFGNKGVIWSGA